ncbi:MAG: hypothetical protein HY482_00465 [Candidatus Wildermuthbacteria bacterium]|nr:hypothetical protein [Candidatus Wildermuthbacteria bacterium]
MTQKETGGARRAVCQETRGGSFAWARTQLLEFWRETCLIMPCPPLADGIRKVSPGTVLLIKEPLPSDAYYLKHRQ